MALAFFTTLARGIDVYQRGTLSVSQHEAEQFITSL
jgi:hypothetical protein